MRFTVSYQYNILTSRNMLNITSALDLSSVTNGTYLYYIFLILKFIIQHIDQLSRKLLSNESFIHVFTHRYLHWFPSNVKLQYWKTFIKFILIFHK